MIISRTPLRISLVGGGSDLAAYYRTSPGAVVSTAINKYIYITVNRKFDSRIRASYSVTEMVDRVEDLKHELIREAMRTVGVDGGIEITSISDIPSEGTGLGSSSTYTVGLLKALYAYCGQHVGAERLAREACEIEIERNCQPIGKQDQYIAAFGGMQYIQFNADESVYVDPVICPAPVRQALQERLLMLFMGTTRSAASILGAQRANTETSPETQRRIYAMVTLAQAMRDALYRQDLEAVGDILHAGWLEKQKLAPGISNGRIDEWYCRARDAGAQGGKVLGAGGGGFLLLYAPVDRQQEILAALPELRRIPFSFEPQGTKIIYVED